MKNIMSWLPTSIAFILITAYTVLGGIFITDRSVRSNIVLIAFSVFALLSLIEWFAFYRRNPIKKDDTVFNAHERNSKDKVKMSVEEREFMELSKRHKYNVVFATTIASCIMLLISAIVLAIS